MQTLSTSHLLYNMRTTVIRLIGSGSLREQYGNNGAAIGMYSIHVGTYSGFESDITENLPPLTQTTSDFIVPLRQAKIKCNTCTASDGSLKYAHPYKKPVVDFHDLEGVRGLTNQRSEISFS